MDKISLFIAVIITTWPGTFWTNARTFVQEQLKTLNPPKLIRKMKILLFWLAIVIFHEHYQLGSCHILFNGTKHLCRQEESQWLLQLKQLIPPQAERPENYYKPMFWNQSYDCCSWDGVTCDESTGDVIGLDLSCSGLEGHIHSNSSLFHLTHLRKLNLAYNNFVGSEISSNFGRLTSLTHLNLSLSGFEGQIPAEFYHLSDLVLLDIDSFFFGPTIDLDIKMLFGNITKIRVLSLSFVNISSELPMNMSSSLTYLDLAETNVHGNLPVTIFEKPNLQILRLNGNDGLTGFLPTLNRSNVRSIKELELSRTSISGRLHDSLGFMDNLIYMRLYGCNFSGPIPESIGNHTQIIEMDLSYNNFSGQIPNAFANLQKLTRLTLTNNYFIGLIPSSITNMSQLNELDISSNALTGPFPTGAAIGLQKLARIAFSNNLIQGMIPPWLLSLPSLDSLDLSSNRLAGQIGKFQCKRLTTLDLSNNQLSIEIESFSNLIEIGSLCLSYNKLVSNTNRSVNATLPKLYNLELSSCGIKEFPDLLRNSPDLLTLDLSNNKVDGPIPSWFKSIRWESLSNLNLSTNYLTHVGYLPWEYLNNLALIDLHTNSLEGTFPSAICNMSSLVILNLSNNKLRGEIPNCIGNSSVRLHVVDLKRNEFYGRIPTFGMNQVDDSLIDLVLNSNHLEGPLPLSLVNCTSLEVLDVGNNKIHDTFPWWLETLLQLQVIILKSNRFEGTVKHPISNNSFINLRILDLSYNNLTGTIPGKFFSNLQSMKNQSISKVESLYMGSTEPYRYSATLSVKGQEVILIRVLIIFTTIDLSSNNFRGHIPESLAYLDSLRLLNLSHNRINGSIPPALGHLTNLEHLDLSSNQLTGGIPWTLTNLTFLGVLNLSYNHLAGRIPKGNQFSTFSNDSYLGNPALCGVPLTRVCQNDRAPEPPSTVELQEEDDESSLMMGFTWKAVVIGYCCGIVFGFIIGNLMISIGKPKWFVQIFNVEAANCVRRLKRRR